MQLMAVLVVVAISCCCTCHLPSATCPPAAHLPPPAVSGPVPNPIPGAHLRLPTAPGEVATEPSLKTEVFSSWVEFVVDFLDQSGTYSSAASNFRILSSSASGKEPPGSSNYATLLPFHLQYHPEKPHAHA